MIVNVINKSSNDLPRYATNGSAGLDLCANFNEPVELQPYSRMLVPTGLFIKIPEGYELQIRPRSGLALKNGITIINSPGTIDSDYINEIGVILVNTSDKGFLINPGDRIAQGILNKVEKVEWNEVDTLEETTRTGGFGSTGLFEIG
jgi:dUTP pyrophosphatase